LIADEIGVAPQEIRIVAGDTDRTPYGWGTFASRSLVIAGGACQLAAATMIPAYRSVGHVRLTNKTPCGTYPASGRFEASFVRERLVDAIADRLGLDPIGVRRRNFIATTAMPFRREFSALGTDTVYDTGDYAGLLDKFLNRVRRERLRAPISPSAGEPARWSAGGSGFLSRKVGSARSTMRASRSAAMGRSR
jgi:CO/xanthine dehydrogenase Mo-binding subunit